MAVFGCLARLLSLKDHSILQFKLVLAELFVSGFSGLMVLLLARATGMTGDWVGVLCGMSGWIGCREYLI
jgi:hypothetical protein